LYRRLLLKTLLLQSNADERARLRHLSVNYVIAWVAFPALVLAVLREARRPRRQRPVIFWGVAPLPSIPYHSQAVKRFGYESVTVVNEIYHISNRSDFDHTTPELVESAPVLGRLPASLRHVLEPYWTFVWALRRCDVFVVYASSAMLRRTPLQFLELQLLRRARKKVVMLAYGGDVQVVSRARNLVFKHALVKDYPAFVREEKLTLRELEYLSTYAHHIVGGIDWIDYMPWWDELRSPHFAIDMDEWTPAPKPRRNGDRVVVFHAPNHRELKGTRFLIAACAELQAEGVPIELRVAEGVPRTRIRELMEEADIVADQFVIGWYAFFAIEAMSLSKPTLCYMRDDLLELYSLFSFAGECPVVNTPPTRIKAVLRELVADADRRTELGRRGREYVERYHSLDAVGTWLDGMFRQLWDADRQNAA
jgi:glycosyltransferase involved in cell wall biosynthesis